MIILDCKGGWKIKEYQRQIAVEQILEELGEKRLLISKYQQLENLKQEPKVIEYFVLLEEIEKLEEKYRYRQTENKTITSVFRRLMNSDFKCNHEI